MNEIPKKDEAVVAAWSQVRNQYKRRADLVLNLVATVKGYARQERETDGRTGILIFVSVAERHVEILADSEINQKVDPVIWRNAVEAFVGHVKAGQVAEGFLTVIGECGAVLTNNIPCREKNSDELPNHLFEI